MTRSRPSSSSPAPAAMGTSAIARVTSGRCRSAGPVPRADVAGSGVKLLDPEIISAHLDRLLRTARALCDSRESAEDLVQETVARVISRPRLVRTQNELAYLKQALRNTFVSSRRTAARRPHVVETLETFEAADGRTVAGPEEAVIAAEVLPAIARLPESFRLALVAVDVAGLSYREAALALGAREATLTTRVYRARRRVARELDPERFGAGVSQAAAMPCGSPAEPPASHD